MWKMPRCNLLEAAVSVRVDCTLISGVYRVSAISLPLLYPLLVLSRSSPLGTDIPQTRHTLYTLCRLPRCAWS